MKVKSKKIYRKELKRDELLGVVLFYFREIGRQTDTIQILKLIEKNVKKCSKRKLGDPLADGWYG